MESALAKVAKIMAREYGLNVRFTGSGACVNLKTKEMQLPALDDPVIFETISGYLDHEVAHVRFTDIVPSIKDSLTMDLFRVLEDVRVDRDMGNLYTGSHKNIGRTRKAVYEALFTEANDLNEMFWMDILEMTSGRMEFDEMGPMAQEAVLKALDLFMGLDEIKTTADCVSLCEKIAKRWRDTDANPTPQPSPGGSEEEQEGDSDGSSDSGGQGDSEGDSKEGSKGGSKKKGKKGSKKEGEEDKDGEGKKKGKGKKKGEGKKKDKKGDKTGDVDSPDANSNKHAPKDGGTEAAGIRREDVDIAIIRDYDKLDLIDPEKALDHGINKIINAQVKKCANDVHIPFTTEYDVVKDDSKSRNTIKEKAIREEVKSTVGVLIRRLQMVLLARDRARDRFELDRGRIDSRRLHQLIHKTSNRVFKTRVEAETESTAVYLLVDCSGSMGGKKIIAAQKAACAFSACLDQLGIVHEVGSFQCVKSEEIRNAFEQYIEANGMDCYDSPFNRYYEILSHSIVKRFDQPFAQGAFANLMAGCNNCDGESVRVAARLLAQRPEKRKILMVFSDGMPSCYSDHDLLHKDLKKAVKEIMDAGIETIGVGIRTSAPKMFYPDWIRINDITTLPTEVISQLEKLLFNGMIGKKRRVA